MSRIPIISGSELIKVLSKIGYQVIRQRGSHIRLRASGKSELRPITVPNHKTVKTFLLLKIIKQAGLSLDDLKKLL